MNPLWRTGAKAGLVLCLLLGAWPGARAQPPQIAPPPLQENLQHWVQGGFPSVSVALATSCGVIWSGAAGEADIARHVPASTSSLYGIGSITKTFVAVVVLQLVEEGKLRLDQTPADILDSATLRHIPNATIATLAQIMNHTSGIPSWEEDPRWIRDARGDGYDPKRQWPETAALSYIRGAKPLGAPGGLYHYSNTNYTLLGLMVEKVTGNRLMAEIRRRILIPLGLKDTYLEGFEAVPEARVAGRYHFATAGYRQAAGMSKLFPEVRPGLIDVSVSRLSPEWAAGGIVTTASDLVKFAVALRDGRLLKPESLRFMMQWRPTDVPGMEVGHGLFRNVNADGTHKINHTGGVLGFSAEMGWLEEADMAMAFLYNAGSVDSGHVPLDWTGAKAFAQAARATAHSSCHSANGTR